jgi:orotidine-5'-phosphate decarboxylase
MTYEQRLQHCTNDAATQLLQLVIKKQSNLCVSLDVTTRSEFLRIADAVGPYIVLLKTHIDIISDYDSTFIDEIQQLAIRHEFLLFEDRKFADIGSTVQHQYRDGIYKISSWAHITNAHILPGEGIIDGLKSIGLPSTSTATSTSTSPRQQRGLLLLAEMSSKGSLATGTYTDTAVKLAEKHTDFVIGFIAQRSLSSNPALLVMTPGVSLGSKDDTLGQQYNTPESVIMNGTDIIIVGRGIIANEKPQVAAAEYQRQGWNAYQKRLKHKQ